MNKLKEKLPIIIAAVLALIIAFVAYYGGFYDELFKGSDKYDFIKFLDVGQSNCTLICNDGYYILVDAGSGDDDGHIIENKLRSLGIKKIDCLVLTDTNTAYIGGAVAVLRNFSVDAVACSDSLFDGGVVAKEIFSLIDKGNIKRYSLEAGKSFAVGDASFSPLWLGNNSEENGSFMLEFNIWGKRFLFAADVLSATEKEMLKSKIDVDCDVFVASNHGSIYSNSKEFLDAATPQICIVSCSQEKAPKKTFKKRLEDRNIRLYTTAQHGDITFYIDADKITYKK